MVYVGGGKMFVRLTSVGFRNDIKTTSFVLINTEQVRYIERFNRGGTDNYFWVFFGDGTGPGQTIVIDDASYLKLCKYLEIV